MDEYQFEKHHQLEKHAAKAAGLTHNRWYTLRYIAGLPNASCRWDERFRQGGPQTVLRRPTLHALLDAGYLRYVKGGVYKVTSEGIRASFPLRQDWE